MRLAVGGWGRRVFDYPRRTGLHLLSHPLGRSPSAVSESLRRAEKQVIRSHLAGLDIERANGHHRPQLPRYTNVAAKRTLEHLAS
ncbi:MAG TPA: helix-turn-helix domain-containing protein [Nitrososphaerales archaeon]|nr:helix-turn-helix domain-containing protein [Nitrososphaerales archaeon]